MSVAVAGSATILHNAVAGRVRVHLPAWSGQGKREIEAKVKQLLGVMSVRANSITGNALICFNPDQISEQQITSYIQSIKYETTGLPDKELTHAHTFPERHKHRIRARIPVRGLDRNPQIAMQVLEILKKYPSVSARVSQPTGRVLVEFEEHEVELEDVVAALEGVELPALPGEDHPVHPLDPGPLFQGLTRVVGSALGLGLLGGRRLFNIEEPFPGATVATQVSSAISIIQGILPVRYGLRHVFGRTIADLLVNIPAIVTLTLSGNLLGLALTEAEALRLVTEVFARRQAWKRHEERVSHVPAAHPNETINLEAGDRPPLPALVLEGVGIAIGRDGMPMPVMPEAVVPASAVLYGGPFSMRLLAEQSFDAFTPTERPANVRPTLYERYGQLLTPISLLYALATGVMTGSFSQVMTSLLLLNLRTAAIGLDSADLSASARAVRAGATVVGTRAGRPIRRPHVLLLDGTRTITDGLETIAAQPLSDEYEGGDLMALAAGIANAAGSPWGGTLHSAKAVAASEGSFDGRVASAVIDGVRHTLQPIEGWGAYAEAARLCQRGNYVLELRAASSQDPIGLIAMRPRLARGVAELVALCRRCQIEVGVLTAGDQLVERAVAKRSGIPLIESTDTIGLIHAYQKKGLLVAFVSDYVGAEAAFTACDLAIGLTNDRYQLPARADILAPDLHTLVAILDAGVKRDAVVRDSVGLSVISNIVGIFWGIRGKPGLTQASRAVYITALAAISDAWLRLRGGERKHAISAQFVDPHPERWGQYSPEETLCMLKSSSKGLTTLQVAARKRAVSPLDTHRHPLWSIFVEQINSPLIGILGLGAVLSLFLGAAGDVAIIAITILANVSVGVWQEYKANRVSEALKRIGTPTAKVVRNGKCQTISARDIVVGDILELAAGDRVAADARVIASNGLEVDESALTGESLPVRKMVIGGTNLDHIVLEGSDVTSGSGQAVVFAVGCQTRMGSTIAVLASEDKEPNPLATRLSRLLKVILPLSFASGGLVMLVGLLRRQPIGTVVTVGASLALTGVPEGLPLLARVSEAGVARRLADRQAVVRRLSSVEALGRVDVACTDKTGTLTEGRLTVSVVTDAEQEVWLPTRQFPERLRRVLLAAAFACPHPDVPGASAHPTDMAVIRAAYDVEAGEMLRTTKHDAELSFDPVRSFHVTQIGERLYLKGSPEALLARCTAVMQHGEQVPLDEQRRQTLYKCSIGLADRGLRVLMVAEGPVEFPLDQPRNLIALGFIGISDPLREGVPESVRRCHEAGVRVIMITGDHPVTARAIGRQAGLLDHGHQAILTGSELVALHNGDLDERLKNVTVIARATPLDKLRIIESLQRLGHVVAMTGDGVNDAPALRLADIGVAMGRIGTEVARQTADVVLINDDFSTLVEALVEGRSFWRNIRRALGLLLGGNLGELGLVAGASLLGFSLPLTTSQILAMNAITDILPATAVALQPPENYSLADLKREGATALDKPLRDEIVRRALSTVVPALIAFGILRTRGNLPQAQSVAYASVVMTQLAQTLDAGRYTGGLTSPVLAAVLGSILVLAATFFVLPIRTFLRLVIPGPFGWLLIGLASIAAVILSRILAYLSLDTQHDLPRAVLSLPANKQVAVA